VRIHRGTFAVLSTGIVLANAQFVRAQDATSANLPEHVDTGEAMLTPKPKKKRAESSLKIAARSSSQKRASVTEQTPPSEGPMTAAAPLEKKARGKKRSTSVARAESPSSMVVTSLSLSAAQAMAVSAPLPAYPYQAKRANITGSGICIMTIDTASGKVTDAMMTQSTGDGILDKVTTNTFRKWRFKPGTVSQVRVPIDYE
jgi:TonB family protein